MIEESSRMLNITVVHHKRQEAAGRRLVHEISLVDGFKAALWSEDHFKANEMKVTGRQPMVFVGPSTPAEHIIPEMPRVFERHNTRAYLEGVRVVLVADIPTFATADELRTLQSELVSETRAILNGTSPSDRHPIGQGPSEVAIQKDSRVIKDEVVQHSLFLGLGLPGALAMYRRTRAAAVEAQYGYLSARFVTELLPQLGDQQ